MNLKKIFFFKINHIFNQQNHQTTKSISHFILLKIRIKMNISSIKLKQDF